MAVSAVGLVLLTKTVQLQNHEAALCMLALFIYGIFFVKTQSPVS